LSNSLEEEMERLRERRVRSAVLWGVGDTLLPKWIGERAAELLGGSFEAVTGDDGWPEARPPDHDWPLRGPEFFAGLVAGTIDGTRGARPTPKRAG